MRTVVGVALVTVCLGLAGCSLFGKKQAAQKGNPKPFLGSETPAKTDFAVVPRDSSGSLPGANGVLAGRVVVEATERPIKASILIKSLDHEDAKKADLDVSTDDSGYFYITKLNANEQYELTARANENGELISCRVYAMPPRPTLLIKLDKRFTTASTPPLPGMPKLRDNKATAGTDNNQEHKPTVSIDPPQTLPDQGSQPSGGIAGPPVGAGAGLNPGGSSPNPANIADGGFHRLTQPPSETVTIPSPPSPPPQPQWENVPDQRQPLRTAPPAVPGGSVRLPYVQAPVPSCLLLGNRLDNFALYDLNGEVWEYKRDRRSRLVLLDFWRHNCGPCLHCIPNLIELQRDFGTYGLEVIGIACETGTMDEQRAHVRPILNRKGVNYKILLSGGGTGRCPVMGQFQVETLPCLVLIDESGYIIYRSPRDGMSIEDHYILRKKINDYLVARQSPP